MIQNSSIDPDGDSDTDLQDLSKLVSGGGTNGSGGILDRVKSMLH